MTGLLLLAAALTLAPADVLANYRTAVAQLRVPRILTFEYTIEQTGLRNGEQVHRIFRSLEGERDELLAVDGKKLVPPKVAIFHRRRYRYALADLHRARAHTTPLLGTRRNARRTDDYVSRPQRARTPRSGSPPSRSMGRRLFPSHSRS